MADIPTIAHRWLDRFRDTTDPIAIVVCTHLCTEYWLNRLIKAKSPTAGEVLDDSRTFTYAVKLTLVYNLGLIPKDLYENLRRLNRLRNKYAHDLDCDLMKQDLNYVDPDGIVKIAEFKSAEESIRNPTNVIAWIGKVTIGWLQNYCVKELGLDPKLEPA